VTGGGGTARLVALLSLALVAGCAGGVAPAQTPVPPSPPTLPSAVSPTIAVSAPLSSVAPTPRPSDTGACPVSPLTVDRLLTADRACFGGREIEVMGWLAEPRGVGGYLAGVDPAWLGEPMTDVALWTTPRDAAACQADGACHFAFLHLPPDTDPWTLPLDRWVRLTGHFEDSLAATCRWNGTNYPKTPEQAVELCRDAFVATAIEDAPDPSSSSAPVHVDNTLVARITIYPDVPGGAGPPMVSVYADGRVLSPGWTIPGHETVPFVVRRLTPSGLATLVAALDAGVPPAGVDYPRPPGWPAGYGTYEVTVRRGDELVTARATNASTGDAAKEIVARAERWRDPVAALPADAWVGGPATVVPYAPRRWYLSIWIPAGGTAVPGTPDASIIRPMIGDAAAFGETVGTRETGILRCGVISDETNGLIVTMLRRAGVDTGTDEGAYRADLNLGKVSVVVASTPLLPDDRPACPADIGP